jgi:hypothetical protein
MEAGFNPANQPPARWLRPALAARDSMRRYRILVAVSRRAKPPAKGLAGSAFPSG